MITVPVSQKFGKLPLNYEFSPASYQALLMTRLQLFLSSDKVLLGTTDSATPVTNVGPWFRPSMSAWWFFDSSRGKYVPIDLGFVNGKFGTWLRGVPTAARTITFPNNTGTVALASDVMIPKATIDLSGTTTPTIDASLSSNFIMTLSGNTTINPILNMASGQRVRIAIINAGTSYTVTWPSANPDKILWPAGVAPVQPVSSPTLPQALGIYTITETTVSGLTPHLFGEPEVTGYAPGSNAAGVTAINLAGGIDGTVLPPPKGLNPYNLP